MVSHPRRRRRRRRPRRRCRRHCCCRRRRAVASSWQILTFCFLSMRNPTTSHQVIVMRGRAVSRILLAAKSIIQMEGLVHNCGSKAASFHPLRKSVWVCTWIIMCVSVLCGCAYSCVCVRVGICEREKKSKKCGSQLAANNDWKLHLPLIALLVVLFWSPRYKSMTFWSKHECLLKCWHFLGHYNI